MKLKIINDILTTQFLTEAKNIIKQLDCNHVFYVYGFGYKCDKCGFYTGSWSKANEEIKKAEEQK